MRVIPFAKDSKIEWNDVSLVNDPTVYLMVVGFCGELTNSNLCDNDKRADDHGLPEVANAKELVRCRVLFIILGTLHLALTVHDEELNCRPEIKQQNHTRSYSHGVCNV